ncbi:MAG: rhodanese-related sulfurtransferase [Gammaproteobacteria bacterium]|nr:rhodanese-related sulfurtransferase [Gammaproteobacteria bacterium]
MKVVSFYRFLDIAKPDSLRDALQNLCDDAGLLGTVLVAREGFNGTLAGAEAAVLTVFDWIRDEFSITSPIDARWTDAGTAPFRRMRVRRKNEVVALGRPDIRPHRGTGRHVSPAEWNSLLDDPDTLLIDTRNHYEIEIGTFPGALDPGTDSFRQFADFAKNLRGVDREKPVAMFCTGGIRCEKASALMQELGFSDVNQLQGGVLNYLEQVDPRDSRWAGECFVFDSRVAVDRDLAEGGYVQCHACRRPLSSYDLKSPDYREGVSCPRCIDKLETDRAARLEERRRQVTLARQRGMEHIGAKPSKPES